VTLNQRNGAMSPRELAEANAARRAGAQPEEATPRGQAAFEVFTPEPLAPRRGLSGVESYWASGAAKNSRVAAMAEELLAARGLGGCCGLGGLGEIPYEDFERQVNATTALIREGRLSAAQNEVESLRIAVDQVPETYRTNAMDEVVRVRIKLQAAEEAAAIARDTAAVEKMLAEQRDQWGRPRSDPDYGNPISPGALAAQQEGTAFLSPAAAATYQRGTVRGEAPSFDVVGLPRGTWKVVSDTPIGGGRNVTLQEIEPGLIWDSDVEGSTVTRFFVEAERPTRSQTFTGSGERLATDSRAPTPAAPGAAPASTAPAGPGVFATLFGTGPVVPTAVKAGQDVYGALFGAPPPIIAPAREPRPAGIGLGTGLALGAGALAIGLGLAIWSRRGAPEPERKKNARRRGRYWR
jgi:hypothetical protein